MYLGSLAALVGISFLIFGSLTISLIAGSFLDGALSISFLNNKIASVVGKIEGYISPKPKGKNGFGYDPIFVPINKKKTFGEMLSYQKYKIDHRSKAFKKIKKFL